MSKNFTYCLAAGLMLALLSSCKKKEYQSIQELDETNISNYISSNHLKVEEFEDTGMYYVVEQEGTGSVLDYDQKVPLVFTLKTLDGSYAATDTFSASNRYYDYLGYFPYGSSAANSSGSPLDKEEGMKVLLKKALKNANGKIRIIVPSRLAFGRNGTKEIPSNASIDYLIHALDTNDMAEYQEQSILQYMQRAGLSKEEFTRSSSGIYYHISQPGTGKEILPTSRFKAAYDLRFFSGESFQKADSITFSLGGVIPAWKEIMPKLKEKGKVRMLIPAAEAYSYQGSLNQMGGYAIPPFVPLDYSVEIQELLD